MHIPKKYLHDKLILLLVSVNIFLALLCMIIVLLRAGIGQGADIVYIIEYRQNARVDPFTRGSIFSILSFMVFSLVVSAINIILSIRTYHLRRTLSVTLLCLGALILLLTAIVSNALLVHY